MDILGEPEANPRPEPERSGGGQYKQDAMDQMEPIK
jgi:hypothetical protein